MPQTLSKRQICTWMTENLHQRWMKLSHRTLCILQMVFWTFPTPHHPVLSQLLTRSAPFSQLSALSCDHDQRWLETQYTLLASLLSPQTSPSPACVFSPLPFLPLTVVFSLLPKSVTRFTLISEHLARFCLPAISLFCTLTHCHRSSSNIIHLSIAPVHLPLKHAQTWGQLAGCPGQDNGQRAGAGADWKASLIRVIGDRHLWLPLPPADDRPRWLPKAKGTVFTLKC